MRTFFKSTVIGLIVFALSFSPTLAGLVNAGGINFEGVSATDSMYQAKGIMFDFSFGGPDDYKKTAFKEVYKNNFTGVDWLILGAGVLTVAVLVLDDDDASCTEWSGPEPTFALRNGVYIPEGYCRAGEPYSYPTPEFR